MKTDSLHIDRRQSLRLLGGGIILAASGLPSLARSAGSSALAPWRDAGLAEEPRRKALSYAILAPNPHNRQPWLIDLRQPDQVIVYRDEARDLPETDPYARQLTIGLGCFLELMRIAAAQDGLAIDMELFPEGEEGPVAIAQLRPGATPDPLFAAVLERRSVKAPYSAEPIPAAAKAVLSGYARILDAPEEVAALKQITLDAWNAEIDNPVTWQESLELMRFGKSEIEANPDGIDLGGPDLEALIADGLLTRETLADPQHPTFLQSKQLYHRMLTETPAYAAIITPGNSRIQQIRAGRAWLRFNLAVTALGLACQPVSQALQEFEAVRPHYLRIHRMLAKPGDRVQMLGRLGFGPKIAQSPRWPLDTRLMTARSN
ncbi:MAG: hypothetical protein RIC87_13355 [Kiloniellales bacterium]